MLELYTDIGSLLRKKAGAVAIWAASFSGAEAAWAL